MLLEISFAVVRPIAENRSNNFRGVVVEYGLTLTSHQTHYMSYRGRFLRVRWPNQQCQALKDNSWSVHPHQVKGQSH